MAMLVKYLKGDFKETYRSLKKDIVDGSISASLEAENHFVGKSSRSTTLVFERYSYLGGNRLSLTINLYQEDDGPIKLVAITAGGSQAMIFKINTLGENSFLAKLEDILNDNYVIIESK